MQALSDIFTLLRLCAGRLRSSIVPYPEFESFVQKYARKHSEESPEAGKLLIDTGAQLKAELALLMDEGKCQVAFEGERVGTIIVPQYFADLVYQEYKRMDESVDHPFPDEEGLSLVVPPEHIKTVSLENDLHAIISSKTLPPFPLARLVFPEGIKAMVLPTALLPKKLLELSVLKVRQYLRAHNNKDYIQHKLVGAFQNKDMAIRDAMNCVLSKPFDAIEQLARPTDFGYSFWAYLCSYIRGDSLKKKDKLPEDWSVLQAASVVEFFNNFYKGRSQKELQVQAAFRALEACLAKQPYCYSINDIERFSDPQGVPLLGKYDQGELRAWLEERARPSGTDRLPDLISFHTSKGVRCFAMKDKVIALCVKLIGEARHELKAQIAGSWFRLMSEFDTAPALEDDGAFREDLRRRLEANAPVLASLLDYNLLYLVFEEMKEGAERIPEAERFFYKGNLAPLDELLNLKRRDLLTDVKVMLPFWYSTPVIGPLIAFFKRLGRKRKASRKAEARKVAAVGAPEGGERKEDQRLAIRKAAAAVEQELLPAGYESDEYLRELENRWNTLIAPEAKKNLREDVESLARDFVRKTLRGIKAGNLTLSRIESLSETLTESPSLMKIKNRGALELYIQLYICRTLRKA